MSELENASAILDAAVSAGKINPSETVITLTNAIRFIAWPGFPAQSTQEAMAGVTTIMNAKLEARTYAVNCTIRRR